MSLVGRSDYKQTSIGLVPIDWSATTLGNEVESIIGGGTPSKDVEAYWGGDIPWASVKDFVGSRLSKTQDYITPQAIDASATNLIPAGTLITPTRMALGRVAIFDCDVAINQDLKAIFPKPSLLRDFLFYWFQENADRIEAAGIGSTVKGIRLEVLREFELALPPIPEQQKIAAILTAVDDKLDVIARQIEATQTLKRGLMQTLFSRGVGTQDADGNWVPHTEFQNSKLGKIPLGWSATTLGNEVESIIGGGTPSKDVVAYWGGDIPWASVKDFVGSRLSKTQDYITPQAINASATNLIPAGTLVTPTRMALGKVAIFDCDVAINQDLKAIFPKPSLLRDFLFYWFQGNSDRIEAAGTGSTVKGIRLEVLREFGLALPPISEQQKITTILAALDDKLDVITRQIDATQTFKKGLMQKLLTGEWRVSVDASASDT